VRGAQLVHAPLLFWASLEFDSAGCSRRSGAQILSPFLASLREQHCGGPYPFTPSVPPSHGVRGLSPSESRGGLLLCLPVHRSCATHRIEASQLKNKGDGVGADRPDVEAGPISSTVAFPLASFSATVHGSSGLPRCRTKSQRQVRRRPPCPRRPSPSPDRNFRRRVCYSYLATVHDRGQGPR